MEQSVAGAGSEALDALLRDAWEILGGVGSPVRLVLVRLAQERPEDAAARGLVRWTSGIGGDC